MAIERGNRILDCIIIGGGPAGMSAALYLVRFRRTFELFDLGHSRALSIPVTHNYPGFINGISGIDLLAHLKNQLKTYGIDFINEHITVLAITKDKQFIVTSALQSYRALNIIIATGVRDETIDLPFLKEGTAQGLIRYCPVCDAYEVIDKKIAVLCPDQSGLNEALFLRTYSSEVTLIMRHTPHFTRSEQDKVKKANIHLLVNPELTINLKAHRVEAVDARELRHTFDTLYVALGCHKRSELAIELGAKAKNGELMVNKHQQTSIPGLYAAGDVVEGLNQLCVAQSQGAIAAMDVHNRCRTYDGLREN